MARRILAMLLLAGLALPGAGLPAAPAGTVDRTRDRAVDGAVQATLPPPQPTAAAAGVTPAERPPPRMAAIPAGVYRPLYKPSELNPQRHPGATAPSGEIPVAPFFLDIYPVTNADYLAFLRGNGKWQRSRIARIFADTGYLNSWAGDLEPGPQAPPERPLVNVSWFAARAYCQWRGGHLPTTAQWEHAASATETSGDGRFDPAFAQRILAWYARPMPAVPPPVGSVFRNVWGVYDLHGLVWEWVRDFNTALVSGESRGDSGLERGIYCAAGSIGAVNGNDYAAFMRYAFRSSLEASYTAASLGFRCAQGGG